LVIADETCTGPELFREMRERAEGEGPEVLVVAPALTSRLRYWMSDEEAATKAASRRLAESLEHCASAGLTAGGALGDADPLQALDDAIRSFDPDAVIIATPRPGLSNWLERGLVTQARERFDLPITHVVVDPIWGDDHVVDREPADERHAPARERHTARDRAVLALAGVLAILGSLVSFVFYALDAADWLIWAWVLSLDLGLKVAAAVMLWLLFLRRPRADRLNL
jgi:hypothetical protein